MGKMASRWLLALSAIAVVGQAKADECNADSAWKKVRTAHAIHSQILARCEDANTGRLVIVFTEPPPHLTPSKADGIIRSLFALPAGTIETVERRRHPLGFDGWAEDLVIVINAKVPSLRPAIDEGLTLLAQYSFGSAYKAEIYDITRLSLPKAQEAPTALEVSKEELFAWLLGPNAQTFIMLDGGTPATLKERSGRNELGTYYSSSPGLIVSIVPRHPYGGLNDHLADLRQFVVESDAFLGAIKLNNRSVALVGRERTASVLSVPPLRLETILLLASEREAQLSQSYERTRAFAGKLLTGARENFGWDWAPILLSDALIDTEFGSLLNFTDNMLKSWSNNGKVEYKGFPHAKPSSYPFGGKSAREFVSGDKPISTLTYNWNTAGVGMVSAMDGTDIFVVRSTGSLPVSYFPEGTQEDLESKARLTRAEDEAYRYFRTLRNPLLQRAVQLSALYQVFAAFDIRSSRPHETASPGASISSVEKILAKHVNQGLADLLNPQVAVNRELLLAEAFTNDGPAAQVYELVPLKPEFQIEMEKIRKDLSSNVLGLDHRESVKWRTLFADLLARGGSIPSGLRPVLEDVVRVGIPLVHSPESVRKEIVQSSERTPFGWIRTPSIVLSNRNAESFQIVGGHNISGRATRIEFDTAVPKGQVKASGSYEEGRVLRLNPADKDAERDVVRLFDREVGIQDGNQSKGVRAVEARLREAPVAPRPIRGVTEALEVSSTRTNRGAIAEVNATQVGIRSENASFSLRPELQAEIQSTSAEIVVATAQKGFVVIRPRPAPPKIMSAPNPTSLHEAINLTVRQVALGPPPMLSPKIAFHGMERVDALRHVQTMVQRGQAAAGAGGKPPFGGSRPMYALGEGPDPQRAFTYSLLDGNRPPKKPEPTSTEAAWDSVLGLIGKRRQRIHSEAAVDFSVKPNWSGAEIRFPSAETTQIIGIPSRAGAMHIVEVTVPVSIAAKPQSLLMRAISWFKDSPTAVKSTEINESLTRLFKSSNAIDLEEALIRYKTLMVDKFGATDVHINLRREGSDIVVTENTKTASDPRG